MLKYNLVDNPLTERPDDFSAQVTPTRSYDLEAVISEMLRRGNLVTRTDAVAVINAVQETVVDIIRDGGIVNLPLFNTSFSISGVFESPLDSFDGNRHKLNVNLSKGVLLRAAEKEVALQKSSTVTPTPNILEVKDEVSGKTNDVLTPGGIIQLWGNNLRIAGTHADVGLWFVPEAGSPVKAEVVAVNKPSSLLAMIPPLTAGKWTVKVVTQYAAGGKTLATPKVNTFNKTLTV